MAIANFLHVLHVIIAAADAMFLVQIAGAARNSLEFVDAYQNLQIGENLAIAEGQYNATEHALHHLQDFADVIVVQIKDVDAAILLIMAADVEILLQILSADAEKLIKAADAVCLHQIFAAVAQV